MRVGKSLVRKRSRSLSLLEFNHFELQDGHSDGRVTCSCLSLLQLVLGFLLLKIAFGKHFMVYFVI